MNRYCIMLLAGITIVSKFSIAASQVTLGLTYQKEELYYTFTNSSAQDYYYVDFLINQSYFFCFRTGSESNLCDISARPVRLDYNYLRKKYRTKLPAGSVKKGRLKIPDEVYYKFVICDSLRPVELVLLYHPGMFAPLENMERKAEFIDTLMISNPVLITWEQLRSLKRG